MTSLTTSRQDKNMRYEGGDVIIQTSAHPSGILVIHSKIICAASDFFQAMLKGNGWSKPRTIINSNGNEQEVWHLHMYFDRELKLFLVTDKPDRLTNEPFDNFSCRRLEYWEINDVVNDPSYLTWTSKDDFDKLRMRQPRKQLAWSDTQHRVYPLVHVFPDLKPVEGSGITDHSHEYLLVDEKMSSYMACYESWQPVCARSTKAFPQDRPTHAQAFQHGTKIWEALISLLYGKPLHIPRKAQFWNTWKFLMEIYVHADYFGMASLVTPRLKAIISGLSELWRRVSELPDMFVMFAYHLRFEQLYLDAVKNLAALGWKQRVTHDAHYWDVAAPYANYTSEVIMFITHASKVLQDKVTSLALGILALPQFSLCNHWRQDRGCWRSSESIYSRTTHKLFLEHLESLGLGLSAVKYSLAPNGDPHDLHSSLRKVWKLLSSEREVHELATAASACSQQDLDLAAEKIESFITIYCEHLRWIFGLSELFGHDEHTCQGRAPGRGSLAPHRCLRCFRAEYERDDLLTFLDDWDDEDTNRIPESWPERGYASCKLYQTVEQVNPEHDTTPATDEHLRRIGLEWCVFPKKGRSMTSE